ncbi:MAG: polyprenyl synthetase family protein [Planctomycetaceae bacterium]|jgi:octaprenyl-diphosphate synthase|nr:polyprenyl synthetase family protein [Planctomycetaceae bacterium]
MSQFQTIPDKLSQVYALLKPDMDALENLVASELVNNDTFVDEVVRYAFRLGGKRLRPALVFLAGHACGKVGEPHYLIATAIELTHTGTLLHDDILDGAAIRRHLATLNVRWDSNTALLAGDLLFTFAMQMITRFDDINCYRIMSDAIQRTCRGELRQMGARNRFDITEGEYLDILSDKTAALIEVSCQLGASESNAPPETVQAFRKYGHHVGMAFQIADDILDLTGVEGETGKTLGTDLINRKATLPLIHYLHTAAPDDREKMLNLVTDDELGNGNSEAIVKETIKRLKESGSIKEARKKAEQYVNRAIEQIPKNTGKSIKTALETIANFAISRKT